MLKRQLFQIGPDTQIAANTEIDYYTKFLLPGKWEIEDIEWVPQDAITANGANYCVFTLTNVTQSQTIATRSYVSTDSVAGTPETPTTVGTGLARVISEGDVIKLAKTDPGTGLAARGHFVMALVERRLP